MRCYDCATQNKQDNEAYAVCVACGAGLCLEHAIEGHAEERARSLGNPTMKRLPGRRIFCKECAVEHLPQELSPGTEVLVD